MKIAALVIAWLAVGVVVAKAVVAVQTEQWLREFEGTGARAGVNVVFWPIALLCGLILLGIGFLVSGKWRG